MKRKMRWNYKKFLLNMYCTISVLLMLWIALSFIEIGFTDRISTTNPTYSPLNAIVLLVKYFA